MIGNFKKRLQTELDLIKKDGLYKEERVIVRTNADKISQQSRAATGVKLQRLDEGDHLSEVVLVPHEQIVETEQLTSGEKN